MYISTAAMGKASSLIRFNGKIGDLVFYKLNGKQVVRRIGKRTSAEIPPAQKRTANEFGQASAAGKTLRSALAEECSGTGDRHLYQRVTQLMLQIKACDRSSNELRSVAAGLRTEEGRILLRNFRFHKKNSVPEAPTLVKIQEAEEGLLDIQGQYSATPTELIELQINFSTGAFRRQVHLWPAATESRTLLKKRYCSRAGFTDLLFVSGPGYLQGAVVETL